MDQKDNNKGFININNLNSDKNKISSVYNIKDNTNTNVNYLENENVNNPKNKDTEQDINTQINKSQFNNNNNVQSADDFFNSIADSKDENYLSKQNINQTEILTNNTNNQDNSE